MASKFGAVVKLGPSHYRVVHTSPITGKARSGNECHWCGKPRPKRAQGKLCSMCNRSAYKRRVVEMEPEE